jgi:sodium-dependent dicarboxylate transporter 2/3/5
MDWETAAKLPWGILLLFGGGLSLAGAISATGLDAFLGSGFEGLVGVPTIVLIAGVVALVIFLTEMTSNTAVTNTLLPVLGAAAIGLGVSPAILLVPMALAASCAFMLPVATPPNAIVFGAGHVTLQQMVKAGFWLNLVGIVLVTLVGTLLVPIVAAGVKP